MPRHQEEIINNMLRAYKINALAFNTEKVLDHETVETDMSEYITIPLEPDDLQYNRSKAIRERKKQEARSRARIKRETRKALEEYERGE